MQGAALSDGALHDAFAELDKDGSGGLDFAEFRVAMHMLSAETLL